jgi:hypothetical protein
MKRVYAIFLAMVAPLEILILVFSQSNSMVTEMGDLHWLKLKNSSCIGIMKVIVAAWNVY